MTAGYKEQSSGVAPFVAQTSRNPYRIMMSRSYGEIKFSWLESRRRLKPSLAAPFLGANIVDRQVNDPHRKLAQALMSFSASFVPVVHGGLLRTVSKKNAINQNAGVCLEK